MPEQRVSDERLAKRIKQQADAHYGYAGIDKDIALDLADARNEIARLNGQTQYDLSAERLAQVEPVVKAAVMYAHGEDCPCTLCGAVNALPESVRKEYGAK